MVPVGMFLEAGLFEADVGAINQSPDHPNLSFVESRLPHKRLFSQLSSDRLHMTGRI